MRALSRRNYAFLNEPAFLRGLIREQCLTVTIPQTLADKDLYSFYVRQKYLERAEFLSKLTLIGVDFTKNAKYLENVYKSVTQGYLIETGLIANACKYALKDLMHKIRHQGLESSAAFWDQMLAKGQLFEMILRTGAKVDICAIAASAEEKIVKHCVGSSLNINRLDRWGQTPLICAVNARKPLNVKALLCHRDIDINVTNQNNKSAFLLACESGQVEMVQYFLAHPRLDLKRDGSRAFILAVKNGHLNIFHALLVHEKEVEYDVEAILLCAARYGRVAVVDWCLSLSNIDVNSRDRLSRTPLLLAVETNQIEVVDKLLKHPQINVNAQDFVGKTALHKAAENKNVPIINKLINKNTNPRIQTFSEQIKSVDNNKKTELQETVECKKILCLQYPITEKNDLCRIVLQCAFQLNENRQISDNEKLENLVNTLYQSLNHIAFLLQNEMDQPAWYKLINEFESLKKHLPMFKTCLNEAINNTGIRKPSPQIIALPLIARELDLLMENKLSPYIMKNCRINLTPHRAQNMEIYKVLTYALPKEIEKLSIESKNYSGHRRVIEQMIQECRRVFNENPQHESVIKYIFLYYFAKANNTLDLFFYGHSAMQNFEDSVKSLDQWMDNQGIVFSENKNPRCQHDF